MLLHKKLFDLLATLTSGEFKRFGKFLRSPYFTASDGAAKFYELLKKHHPDYDPKKMRLEANFEKLFAERLDVRKSRKPQTEDEKAIRNEMRYEKLAHLQSDLYHLLKTFLVVEEALFEQPSVTACDESADTLLQARQSNGISLRDDLLVRALSRRPAYDLYMRHSQALAEKVETLPVKNTDDYWLLCQLHHWQYYHPNTRKLDRQIPGVPEAMRQLDYFYLLSKLRYIAELLAQAQIRPAAGNPALMNEVIALATALVEAQRGQPPMAQAHPLIAVYLELVSLYLNPEGEDIQYLLANKLFRQHSSMLTIQEQRLLLAHLISIGVRQFILENHTIGPELLSLYRWALDNGLLVVNHFMTEITFLNISALAVDCGDLEFAADFIQQWNSLVVEQYRNDAVHAALGLLCFAKGEFDQAHENIRDIVTNRPPYNLLIRSLLLKLYFERLIRDKGQFDVFRDYAVAFERYIMNQDLVGTRQEAWLNYVRSALSLANFWVKEGWLDANDKAHFRAELEAMRFVCSKNWILQKIEEMK